MKSNYYELLKKPQWQKKRLEILERAKWVCECCGNGEDMLHVHHKIYKKNANPWEYKNDDLVALCECCHSCWHVSKEDHDDLIARLNADGPFCISEATALLAGWSGEYITPGMGKQLFAIGKIARAIILKNPSLQELDELLAAIQREGR
jgi:hypothetical protein